MEDSGPDLDNLTINRWRELWKPGQGKVDFLHFRNYTSAWCPVIPKESLAEAG